ncbi:hypothetical protein COOONC_19318 [Cooperia oncophora]
MSSLYSTGYAVMCLCGALLGHEDVLGHSLSLLLFVPVIPGVLSTLAIVLMPETPKFLMISRPLESKNTEVKEPEGGIKAVLTTKHLRGAFAISVAVLILTLPFYPILQNSTHFFTHLQVPKSDGVLYSNIAQLSSSLLMVLLTCSCITSTCIVDKLPRRVGVGPVAWFISPELVPLQYRSAMFCLCYAVHSVLVVLTNFATIPLLGVSLTHQ